jgi:sec-independent protein translocase protein TatA
MRRARDASTVVTLMAGLENPLHILILLVLVLVLFGAKRLPEIGRSLGTGMREFKDSLTTKPETAPPPALSPPPDASEQRPGPQSS